VIGSPPQPPPPGDGRRKLIVSDRRRVDWLTLNSSFASFIRFLPRDRYAQRGLCRGKMSVRLSVRPSHAGILLKRLNIPSKFFHIILLFPYQTRWQYSDADPLTGTSNARGMKKSRFSTKISLYR